MQLKEMDDDNRARFDKLMRGTVRLFRMTQLLHTYMYMHAEESNDLCELCVHCPNRDDTQRRFSCDLENQMLDDFIAKYCIPGVLKYMEDHKYHLDKDDFRITWEELYPEEKKEEVNHV